ncbi:MAG: alr [Ilumatobacteraceae bacterium]|nr:alr [Ilumatobacteraceae bacterium]
MTSAQTSDDASVGRWAWAQIDLDAVRHNIGVLRAAVAPSDVWAVVKADGYGHGAVRVAQAALEAGASGLCVALVGEGLQLRAAGIDSPILVLSEQPAVTVPSAVAAGLTMTVASHATIDALAALTRAAAVHLKVDTGMHRVGCDPADAVQLAQSVLTSGLTLEGVFTHMAVADEPDDAFNGSQLDRFDQVLGALRSAGIDPPLVHAANSAASLSNPRARRSFVRAGIATYGISPGAEVDRFATDLRPALSLRARVSVVRRVSAGDRISYGLRHRFEHDTTVAVVPLGYADGVPRRSFQCGVEVLVAGRRRRIVGTVTMDQFMIDVGDDEVAVGDQVVLIGTQGDGQITAAEWAERLGTIGYEIVCGISARVPRVVCS